jgi:hypothetical protein
MLVDGIYFRGRTDQLAQGESEGTFARAKIRPNTAWRQASRTEQVNVVSVFHMIRTRKDNIVLIV